MRVIVRNDVPVLVFDLSETSSSHNVLIQALTPTAIFFDKEPRNLDNLDAGGTPKSGFFLTNALAPIVLPGAIGKMYARSSVQGEIEVYIQPAQVQEVKISSGKPNSFLK